jgi:hypothetical protein
MKGKSSNTLNIDSLKYCKNRFHTKPLLLFVSLAHFGNLSDGVSSEDGRGKPEGPAEIKN